MPYNAAQAGIFRPSEMKLLELVFKQLRVNDQSPEARDHLASRIIANFMAGVRDESELMALSKQPLGR
jgi:hypothetical protein